MRQVAQNGLGALIVIVDGWLCSLLDTLIELLALKLTATMLVCLTNQPRRPFSQGLLENRQVILSSSKDTRKQKPLLNDTVERHLRSHRVITEVLKKVMNEDGWLVNA